MSPNPVKIDSKTKKSEREDIELIDIWRKLKSVQSKQLEIEERQKELKAAQDKIKKEVTGPGGIQPSKKGLEIFEKDSEDKFSFTEIGREIFLEVRNQNNKNNRGFTRKDLEDILIEFNRSRTKPTHISYLKKIAGELENYFQKTNQNSTVEYRNGSSGGIGGGTPSRIILNYE